MSDRICSIGSVAGADILRSLRDLVLDESEALPGLLRKCAVLGADTGSDDLRAWANNELKGYADDATLPPYRFVTAQLYINKFGGYQVMTHHPITRSHIPKDLRYLVPEKVHFRQSVEELSGLAASSRDQVTMSGPTFALAADQWTQRFGEFQGVSAIYFEVPTPAIKGVVDMVRTTLLEMVIDMTKDVPLDKLPSQAKVDRVLQVHTGSNNYEVNIGGSNSGIIGQGSNFSQVQNSSVSEELIDLISALRATLPEITDEEQRADAEQAIADFEESVSEDDPKPEKAKRRWAMLERVCSAIGNAVLNQAVKEGAPVVMEQLHLMV